MCTKLAPASYASCVDSICSDGVIGTAGLSRLRGTDPVIATAITTGFIVRPQSTSDIKKDGFALALKIDVEHIDDVSALLFAMGDQGFAPHGLLDDVEHRVAGISLRLI